MKKIPSWKKHINKKKINGICVYGGCHEKSTIGFQCKKHSYKNKNYLYNEQEIRNSFTKGIRWGIVIGAVLIGTIVIALRVMGY